MVKRVAITGYKSFELGIFKDNDPSVTIIKKVIQQRLEQYIDEGLEWVIISGQLGIELWAGQVVIEMKKEYPELQLAIIAPFIEQDSKWNETNKLAYSTLINAADYTNSVSHSPYESPQQFRDKDVFLIKNTDGALVIYDEEQEGGPKFILKLMAKYAETTDYIIDQVDFFQLQDIASGDGFID
ncbi:DUF1273 domain-containing protein [Brochothrix thermosphacta]|uniref:DUF1273 domain-containing protein n=1 Tax=Brochothrix thermosphacta TaxID=2756 RepID=UPI000EE36B3B|nr:DUF1273 domain-containing protein [Brochothrix thermosphacta]HCZ40065.1 hypothetical protein [Brochothrix thermosphacta]HCZ45382.1 hypothetical protein [Brochothrix thermosphacta]